MSLTTKNYVTNLHDRVNIVINIIVLFVLTENSIA